MKYVKSIGFLAVVLVTAFCLSGCGQFGAKTFGGTATVQLEPGQKLEMVTWKDETSLWFQTRARRPNEPIERHTFKESAIFGLMEGTVIIEER